MKTQLIILLLLSANLCFGQYKAKKKPSGSNAVQSTQWWIGIKAGTNVTNPNPSGNFGTFSYTDTPSLGNGEKNYAQYNLPGYQFGFIVDFEFFKGLSARIQPAFSSFQYSYSVDFLWASQENANKNVALNYVHTNQLQYLDLPLTFKYQLASGKTKPYIQAGAYLSSLLNATKKVEEEITDNATGGNTIFDKNEYAGQIKDYYVKSNWGLVFGAGVTQNLGNARFGLEVNYRKGMKNISNSSSRYLDNQFLSGVFDAQDDIKLDVIEISLSVVMPLKFITSKDYVPL